MDHRLGYPAILLALAENLPPEPTPARLVTPARDRLTPELEERQRMWDSTYTALLCAPPAVKRREPDEAYSTEHFAATFRPEAEPKEVVEAQQEQAQTLLAWQKGAPPTVGWFNVQDDMDRRVGLTGIYRYHFGGGVWSEFGGCPLARMGAVQFRYDGSDGEIRWRGERKTGEEFPEPMQA